MPNMQPKPTEFRRGEEQISAEKLNQIVRATLRTITGQGVEVSRFGQDRVVISSDNRQIVAAPQVLGFIIVEEFEDYLKCVSFGFGVEPLEHDPELGETTLEDGSRGTEIYVAKPRLLQQTPYLSLAPADENDIGYTYVYTGINSRVTTNADGVSFPESIVDPYLPGSIIFAYYSNTGYNVELSDGAEYAVMWTDLNIDARKWSSNNSAMYAYGVTSGVITAISGVTPGTGTVLFYEINDANEYVPTGFSAIVKNRCGEIADSWWVDLHRGDITLPWEVVALCEFVPPEDPPACNDCESEPDTYCVEFPFRFPEFLDPTCDACDVMSAGVTLTKVSPCRWESEDIGGCGAWTFNIVLTTYAGVVWLNVAQRNSTSGWNAQSYLGDLSAGCDSPITLIAQGGVLAGGCSFYPIAIVATPGTCASSGSGDPDDPALCLFAVDRVDTESYETTAGNTGGVLWATWPTTPGTCESVYILTDSGTPPVVTVYDGTCPDSLVEIGTVTGEDSCVDIPGSSITGTKIYVKIEYSTTGHAHVRGVEGVWCNGSPCAEESGSGSGSGTPTGCDGAVPLTVNGSASVTTGSGDGEIWVSLSPSSFGYAIDYTQISGTDNTVQIYSGDNCEDITFVHSMKGTDCFVVSSTYTTGKYLFIRIDSTGAGSYTIGNTEGGTC